MVSRGRPAGDRPQRQLRVPAPPRRRRRRGAAAAVELQARAADARPARRRQRPRWHSSRSSGSCRCAVSAYAPIEHAPADGARPGPAGAAGRWSASPAACSRRLWCCCRSTFLVVEAQQSGWSEVQRLLFRHSVAVLLWNTIRPHVRLHAPVRRASASGPHGAWSARRCRGRRLWAVLLVLPLGIPDFVVGFGWVSLDHSLHGYWAAVLVMTLSLYPLVYLPGRDRAAPGSTAACRRRPAASAWGHGAPSGASRCARSARRVLGGCLLVTLGLLAEYGAFEIVQYQTFTVAIFTEFKLGFDAVSACALSLVLVSAQRGGARRRARAQRARRASGAAVPGRAGRRRAPSSAAGARRCAAGARAARARSRSACRSPRSSYWMIRGSSTTLPDIVDTARPRPHGRVQRRRRGPLDPAGDPRRRRSSIRHRNRFTLADRAPGVPADGAAGPGDRARARLLHRALRAPAV